MQSSEHFLSSLMTDEEMDLDMDQDCPDFNQIKSSPSTSPAPSPRSVKENSVILEARDLSSVGKSRVF